MVPRPKSDDPEYRAKLLRILGVDPDNAEAVAAAGALLPPVSDADFDALDGDDEDGD